MPLNENIFRKNKVFWKYFELICKIPRCSGHEERIRDFIQNEVKKFNFTSKTDKVGNLLVELPLQDLKGIKRKIIFQSHLDMVCEKNEETSHDFAKDPIEITVIEQDGNNWVKANGTTLGADNGAGIAHNLELMALISTNMLKFDNLDISFLFTVEEETGLVGAFNIDSTMINADYLINLDSESDDRYTIGCAGGINTSASLKFKGEPITDGFLNSHAPFEIFISGLKGGHSGGDINKGRINAIKLIIRLLEQLLDQDIRLVSINGGHLSNAIPREAKAIVFFQNDCINEIQTKTENIFKNISSELSEKEPNLEISLKKINIKDVKNPILFPKIILKPLVKILAEIPDGPQSWVPNDAALVHTSTNLAIITTIYNKIEIITSQRSLNEITKKEIQEKVQNSFQKSGLEFNIIQSGDYPGWEPNYESDLLSIAKKAYRDVFNQDVLVKTIHAGLECGILKRQFPKIEMISLGPTILGAHSPDERLNVKSVEKIKALLLKLIEELSK